MIFLLHFCFGMIILLLAKVLNGTPSSRYEPALGTPGSRGIFQFLFFFHEIWPLSAVASHFDPESFGRPWLR